MNSLLLRYAQIVHGSRNDDVYNSSIVTLNG